MRIQNNIAAENSHRQLGITVNKISVNTERLSSGFRVNRAADDAAGLAISEKMRTQIRGLDRASLNIQDGTSLLQVGDGALQFVHDKMQRLRELAVQAANDTNQLLDREAIQLEFGQLTSEINEVISRTNFNGRTLFDGSIGASWEYNLGMITAPFISTISAENDFSSAGVNVPGWTMPTNFGSAAVPTNFGAAGFPTVGVYAMQIVTPANGTFNVFLNFADENADGTMDRTGFLNFFRDEFNSLSNSLGLGDIVDSENGVRYNSSASRIEFDFPREGNTLLGVMGQPSEVNPPLATALPRVLIGLGSGTGALAPLMRNSLNEVATGWAGEPFRSNRPDLLPITSADFADTTNLNSLGSVPGAAAAPSGGFPNATITIGGRESRIFFTPGNYPTIEDFVEKNIAAFDNAVPRGSFEIDIVDGKLVVTATSSADGPPPATPPAVTFQIHPVAVANALGFGTSPTVTTEPDSDNSLWIQSGANEGDGIDIMIPRLCTRSLGISIRRPDDVPDDAGVSPSGLIHFNVLGADGYAQKANVFGDPMEYSLDVTSHESASAAMTVLTNAINIISMERARMGAQQNRLDYARMNVDNTSENLQAAESRIRDTDMAAEMTTFVQNQILQQAGTAMLAQANALPQGVLQLLG